VGGKTKQRKMRTTKSMAMLELNKTKHETSTKKTFQISSLHIISLAICCPPLKGKKQVE